MIVLSGGMVCEGLLSGSAAAFGGHVRTDPEGGSGETHIAWAGVGRACWVRSTVGGLGSEGDKTVLLGPKNWNPISSSKCTVLARHG